ncbi:Dynein light chain roadblock-type 2, partial [Schistosoma haematobium]
LDIGYRTYQPAASSPRQPICCAIDNGIAVRTSMDNSTTNHYCGLIQQLVAKSRSAVRDLDPSNDLTFLRIRSTRNEIMVAPDRDYSLIVIQETSTE